MAFHHIKLFFCEAPRFVQYFVRNRKFADIMEQPTGCQSIQIITLDPEKLSQQAQKRRDSDGVHVGIIIVPSNTTEEILDTIVSNRLIQKFTVRQGSFNVYSIAARDSVCDVVEC